MISLVTEIASNFVLYLKWQAFVFVHDEFTLQVYMVIPKEKKKGLTPNIHELEIQILHSIKCVIVRISSG